MLKSSSQMSGEAEAITGMGGGSGGQVSSRESNGGKGVENGTWGCRGQQVSKGSKSGHRLKVCKVGRGRNAQGCMGGAISDSSEHSAVKTALSHAGKDRTLMPPGPCKAHWSISPKRWAEYLWQCPFWGRN